MLLLTSRDAGSRRRIANRVADRATSVSLRVGDRETPCSRANPPWGVLDQGGITSHDVAVTGLGIRRAEAGRHSVCRMVSVYDDLAECPASAGVRRVRGNVGDENALAEVGMPRMSARREVAEHANRAGRWSANGSRRTVT